MADYRNNKITVLLPPVTEGGRRRGGGLVPHGNVYAFFGSVCLVAISIGLYTLAIGVMTFIESK
ncbi:hypothetical protein K1T71_009503 [Dendrolimus kikuchii]|uniref:Uncharacterized protein n=1 Tax=Dendrolimus kikuchii TaxID=765133 RepID=A0ACC1CVR3_9NEOP|nr:hypothetical protein K1T71_009503 [Dendrolimus kikuchii]